MIDILQSSIKTKEQDLGGVPLLILGNSDVTYCTIVKEYSSVIKELHKQTFFVNLPQLYQKLGFNGTKSYLLEYLQKNNIRIIYFQDLFCQEFELNFIEDLREKYFIFGYFADICEHFNSSYRYISQPMDLVLTDTYYEKFLFKIYGIDALFLPPSYDSRIYNNRGFKGREIDVSFVGRADRVGRIEYIDFLKRNKIKLEIFGEGSNNGVISTQRMVEIFNASKINLNFSGVSKICAKTFENKMKQVKGRCAEVALTKSFLLTEYAPGMERLFDIGSEVDVFYDKYDLLKKINYYLQNSIKSQELAQKAQEKALRDYESRQAWKKILMIIYGRFNEKRYIKSILFTDAGFINNVNKCRAVYILKFIMQKKIRAAREEFMLIARSGKFNIPQMIFAISGKILRDLFVKYPKLKKTAEFLTGRLRKKH